MHPFSVPWKHQKTLRFSDVFREVEKGCIGNEWVNNCEQMHSSLRICSSAIKKSLTSFFVECHREDVKSIFKEMNIIMNNANSMGEILSVYW